MVNYNYILLFSIQIDKTKNRSILASADKITLASYIFDQLVHKGVVYTLTLGKIWEQINLSKKQRIPLRAVRLNNFFYKNTSYDYFVNRTNNANDRV